MKKKKIEKEIEKRLSNIITDGSEINVLYAAYKAKASKKEMEKFKDRICEKYEKAFEITFDTEDTF